MEFIHASSRYRALSAVISILAFMITICIVSCSDSPSGPVQPDFTIVSIVFTGDSTGTEGIRSSSRSYEVECRYEQDNGQPFCQVTVAWNPPDGQAVLSYSLHRSTESGFSSGSRVVGTTTDTLLADSDSLQWASTYFYIVSALISDSTLLWSDEGSISTPESPLPTPSQISAISLPMGRCILNWSQCPDSDFSNYTLVRRGDLLVSEVDTLGIFDDVQDTMFVDSILPMYIPRNYHITTTNALGLTSGSNMLQYYDGFGLPWRMDLLWQGPFGFGNYVVIEETMAASSEGEYIFFVELLETQYPYDYAYYLRRINTNNKSTERLRISRDAPSFAYVPGRNALLISRMVDDGTRFLELRDAESFRLIAYRQVGFECDGMLVPPNSGFALVHPVNSSSSILLNLSTVGFADTLDYAFSKGRAVEGFGTYIWGVGGLRRLDPITFEITASRSIDVHGNILASSSGALCFINSSTFYQCDHITLATLYSANLPYPESAALLEVQDTVFAYLYTFSETVTVFNTVSLENTGDVMYDEGLEYVDIFDMVALPQRDEIWCTSRFYDLGYDGAFSISR